MSGSKLRTPIVLACLFALSNGSAIAGSRSALDINDTVQPTARSHNGNPENNDTYVKMMDPNEEFLPKVPKAPKVSKKPAKGGFPKIGFPKFQHDDDSVKTAKAEQPAKPKQSKSSLEKEDRLSGGGIGGKTKGFGSSIANAAKSSGGFFFKGTRAIGSSMKKGSEAVGSKMASLPGLGHSDGGNDKQKQDKEPAPARAVASKPSSALPLPKIRPTFGQIDPNADWSASSKPSLPTTSTSNTKQAKTPSGNKGFFGKAMGKVPFL